MNASARVAEPARLFVAVELPARTRAGIHVVAERLEAAGLHARRVPPENYHATVAFLGSVANERRDEVGGVIREVAAASAPLHVSFDRIGGFPDARRPNVVWVGARHDDEPFRALCERIRAPLRDRGFVFADAAVLHVTIFRARTAISVLPHVDVPPVAPLDVTGVALYRSEHTASGVRYAVVERCPLGRAETG